jgi:hypothetical protein
MAFANSSYSDILATAIESRSGELADNVTKNNALLAYLKKRGNIKTISGGSTVLQELSFAENGNAGWYSGYDILPTAAQDVISAAQFTLKQLAVPVVISGLEKLQNAGKEQTIDLMESRVSVAEATMANYVAQGIYSDGTTFGGKTLTGLAAALLANPTAGVYGGIDAALFPFWRNQVYDLTTAATAANVQGAFNSLWAKMVRGMDRPDLIIVPNDVWAAYMASLQAIQRFTDPKSAELGFSSIKYFDADVVLDGGVGGFMSSSVSYFLNTKYLFFRPHKDRNMVPLNPGKRYAINQDAEIQILGFAGNMTCSNRSLQGRLKAS